jgi:hypothetical protein
MCRSEALSLRCGASATNATPPEPLSERQTSLKIPASPVVGCGFLAKVPLLRSTESDVVHSIADDMSPTRNNLRCKRSRREDRERKGIVRAYLIIP